MEFRSSKSTINTPSKHFSKYFGLFLILLFQVVFCSVDIKNFSEPMTENSGTDVEQWENMSYYVAEHISFKPFPQLQLTNNDYFYPYGSTHVFQGWFLEGNYVYAFFYKLYGNGPWLNYYYAFSVLFSALSIFFLVGYFWNYQRATLVALLVTYLNFHAINRYPHHFAYCIIHWTTISIFLDFILIKKFLQKELISLRLVLFKIMIMTLALGLDLSYILGFALSSFFFSMVFITILCFKKSNHEYLKTIFQTWHKTYRSTIGINLLMIGITLTAFWLYVPIILQVFKTIKTFHFANPFAGGHAWTLPLRLLFPYFPFFNATFNPFQEAFRDMPEGMGAMSPGLFCLAIGILGFSFSNKSSRFIMIPFGVFFVLSVFNHPLRVPTLQWLPWCMLYRIPTRFTMLIPIFCSFLFLLGDYKTLSQKTGFFLISIISVIGILEIYTVYKVRYERPAYHYTESFSPYMKYVEQQKGEAVLDWPFCTVGGNGIGNEEGLCPIYNKSSSVHTFRRFHHKKVMGHYYGRLHPSLIQPLVDAGWGKMAEADSKVWNLSTQLTNNFTPSQWEFFTEFFKLNDFVGINLYIDLIPKSQQIEFYRRFGKPVRQTTVPIAGRVVFIPKPKQWLSKVNLERGKKIQFPCGCK